MSRLLRCGNWLTPVEHLELARHLATIEHHSRHVLRLLNGRVKVAWIDPLATLGSATRFYRKLRSALDDEWCRDSEQLSPYYGAPWRELAEDVDITPVAAERGRSRVDA
jgi:hypothetical protein